MIFGLAFARENRQAWQVACPWALENKIYDISDHRIVVIKPDPWAATVREGLHMHSQISPGVAAASVLERGCGAAVRAKRGHVAARIVEYGLRI